MIEKDVSGADVLRFPKGHKPPPDGSLMLVPRSRAGECNHYFTSFEVDTEEYRCRCLKCGEQVSPYTVLRELMRHESQWMKARQAYIDERAAMQERRRTKCQHCGEMTRISQR